MSMRFAQALFWLAVWLGGLIFAGQRYELCRANEGSIIPGCNLMPEYLGWAAAVVGMAMLARALMTFPLFRSWFE